MEDLKPLIKLVSIIVVLMIVLMGIHLFDSLEKEKAYNEELLLSIQERDKQLEDLEGLSNELIEDINDLLAEQEEIKTQIGLEEEVEGIGGPDEDNVLVQGYEFQSKVDTVKENLDAVKDGISTAVDSIDQIEAQVAILSAIPDYSPLAVLKIGSGYGYRIDPITGVGTMHSAVDFAGRRGTEIYAAGSGEVTTAGWSGAYGYLVTINHGNGYITMYAHCSELYVQVGDIVEKGQLISAVGSTGYATGSHLHFMVLYDGRIINPLSVLAAYN